MMGQFNEMTLGGTESLALAAMNSALHAVYDVLNSSTSVPSRNDLAWRYWHYDNVMLREHRAPPVEVHATLRDCTTVYREAATNSDSPYLFYRHIAGRSFPIARESVHPTHMLLATRIAAYLAVRGKHA